MNSNSKWEKCFRCRLSIEIKYVYSKKDYGSKNNWGYWTEKEEDQTKSVCQNCLLNLYHNHKVEFQQLIPNLKKQARLRQYINVGLIKGQIEPCWVNILHKKIKKRKV